MEFWEGFEHPNSPPPLYATGSILCQFNVAITHSDYFGISSIETMPIDLIKVSNTVLTEINRKNEVGSFAKFSGVMVSSLPVLMLSFISSFMLSQICRNLSGSAKPTQEIRHFTFTNTDTKYISASPKWKVVQKYGFYLFKMYKGAMKRLVKFFGNRYANTVSVFHTHRHTHTSTNGLSHVNSFCFTFPFLVTFLHVTKIGHCLYLLQMGRPILFSEILCCQDTAYVIHSQDFSFNLNILLHPVCYLYYALNQKLIYHFLS